MKKAVLLSALCALSTISLAAPLWACPACKDAVSSQADPVLSAKLTRGYARSIAVLMSTPYLLFAGVTFTIVRSARRHRKR